MPLGKCSLAEWWGIITNADRGEVLFQEKLLECYQPGGWNSYRNNMMKVYLFRGVNIVLIILLITMVSMQFELNQLGAVAVLCDFLSIIGILMTIVVSECLLYRNGGISSRPVSVNSNGLMIPPIYLRALSKEKGFVYKGLIDHIEVRWHKKHIAAFAKRSGIIWYDAPVEFIVHLKGGKTISSGKRPPETIREAVETMQKAWGIKVNWQGFGNGRMKRTVNQKVVEERNL
jgi:hypothetical protein